MEHNGLNGGTEKEDGKIKFDLNGKSGKSLNTTTTNIIKESTVTTLGYDDEDRKVVNQYLFLNTIGKGSYAKVKVCLDIHTNTKYAVKIINKGLLRKKKKGFGRDSEGNMTIIYMLEDAMNEINILKKLNENGGHKNVIKLYEIITDEQRDKTYLILEYCEKGSLMEYNERTGIFKINKSYICGNKNKYDYSEDELRGFIEGLTCGLQFIHAKNIIHRDIKTDNILIDSEGTCKFSDFNIASIIEGEDRFTKTEGNLYFYPPEFCNDKINKVFRGKPVDVWAIGVTLYIATFKKMPFLPNTPSNLLELFKAIETSEVNFPKEKVISKEFKDLLMRFLEKDPDKRITLEEILIHPFITG